MLTLEMVRCFQTVAKHGGLAAAASELGRTVPAVSVMLKNFENRVGAPLFEAKRKSHLTPLGVEIFAAAQQYMEEFGRLEGLIDDMAEGGVGRVRLAVTPTVATALMPGVVRRFTARHPKVLIELRDMDSNSIRRELERKRADIGVATLPPLDGFERKRLLSDELGVLCPHDHPLATKTEPLTWSDIGSHNFIKNGLCYLVQDPEFIKIVDGSKMSVTNHESLIAFLKSNLGITVLPRLALPSGDNSIAFLPLPGIAQRRVLYLITPPKNRLSPAAVQFVKVLEEFHEPE